MNVKEIAQAVLAAVKLYNESYDQQAADAATGDYVDYSSFYKKSLEECCEEAAPTGMGQLIYLALYGWWNDTIDWALMITDPSGTVTPTLKHCQHGQLYSPPSMDSVREECPLCQTFRETYCKTWPNGLGKES